MDGLTGETVTPGQKHPDQDINHLKQQQRGTTIESETLPMYLKLHLHVCVL